MEHITGVGGLKRRASISYPSRSEQLNQDQHQTIPRLDQHEWSSNDNLVTHRRVRMSFTSDDYTADHYTNGALRAKEAVRMQQLRQDAPQDKTKPFNYRCNNGITQSYGYWTGVNDRQFDGMQWRTLQQGHPEHIVIITDQQHGARQLIELAAKAGTGLHRLDKLLRATSDRGSWGHCGMIRLGLVRSWAGRRPQRLGELVSEKVATDRDKASKEACRRLRDFPMVGSMPPPIN